MIYETIEIVDQSAELKELQTQQTRTQQTIQELFALQRQQENLKEENKKLQERLNLLEQNH
mgnify:CR=1 FL=1